MTEHGFMVAMLALGLLETLVAIYLAYRVYRSAEQIEGLTAATYLEARKALERLR
jgi:hypothetical protein